MRIIAGLDFGTSSVKLAVLTLTGEVLARAQAEYPTTTGPAGESEQDPDHWWAAAAAALTESGFGPQIDALGITGQMQDLIPVAGGRAGAGALRPALLYSDTRAAAQHARLIAELPHWEQSTGNQQDVTNVAAKIAWLAEHEPDSLTHADALLLGAPGYIGWRATGVAACDVFTASTTGLLGIRERGWLADVARVSGVQLSQLPQLVGMTPGDGHIGSLTRTAATELGVREGIPIVLAMGDAGAATDGLVGADPGDAYLYLGTTGWFAAVTAAPSLDTPPSPIHSLVMPGWESRLRIGAVQSAGSAADWARRTFFAGKSFAEVEQLVSMRVSDPAAIAVRPITLPGISGERTPVRDASFRGAFVGVHEFTEAADFYLGVLTGVAMALRHAADELNVVQDRIALVGGAANSPVWRQILADVFDATIVTRPTNDPGTHAAVRSVIATLQLGDAPAPLFTPSEADVVTDPLATHGSYGRLIRAHRELYDTLTPMFHSLVREA